MRRNSFILLVMLLAALLFPFQQARSAGISPLQTASTIREALFNAQMAMRSSPGEAGKALAAARSAYTGEFSQSIQAANPQAHERITNGFTSAEQSLSAGQDAGFAAARAQIWTAVLDGSFAVVEQAVLRNDAAAAQYWLPLREYRLTTRFSRPSTSATLAVDALAQGTNSPEEALQAVHADLLDTYQAELTEALHDLPAADAQDFTVRRAELAALAEGYFIILSPAFSQQRGEDALQSAQAAFRDLRSAALEGKDLDAPIQQVDTTLRHFRAAPLTPSEQARRAGQLLRYLSLVPLEYNRGVKGTQVVHDFEIQEAITFFSAAQAAFADLASTLDTRSPDATAQAKTQFDLLESQLDQAARRVHVVTGASIQEQTTGLSEILENTMPPEWAQASSAGDFDVIASLLDQMEAAVISKEYAAAESARLEGYAIMEVGPEARLMAFAPQLKMELENLFWNGQAPYAGLAYLIKNHAPHQEIQATRQKLDEKLNEAQTVMRANNSPAAMAVNAGMIMFREGLEAVIILASLMSSMKRPEERKYRKPMWLGALLALCATALTWVLAHDVLKVFAPYGEKLEAVVSLIAIVILLIIMNWFFHKIYWTGWIANFHARKRKIISGEAGLLLGLVILGFTSIYREGFETVLFLQALVLEAGLGAVLTGVAGALVAVCLVGFIAFRLQVNLPYKKMLVVTGILIGAVLLQMVGNTVHGFQLVGWLPIHTIGSQPLPYWLGTWFGVYATWEGIVFQMAAALFVVGSYFLAENLKQGRRRDKAGSYHRLT